MINHVKRAKIILFFKVIKEFSHFMVDNDNAEITLLVLKVKVFKLRNMPDIFTHTLFSSI